MSMLPAVGDHDFFGLDPFERFLCLALLDPSELVVVLDGKNVTVKREQKALTLRDWRDWRETRVRL